MYHAWTSSIFVRRCKTFAMQKASVRQPRIYSCVNARQTSGMLMRERSVISRITRRRKKRRMKSKTACVPPPPPPRKLARHDRRCLNFRKVSPFRADPSSLPRENPILQTLQPWADNSDSALLSRLFRLCRHTRVADKLANCTRICYPLRPPDPLSAASLREKFPPGKLLNWVRICDARTRTPYVRLFIYFSVFLFFFLFFCIFSVPRPPCCTSFAWDARIVVSS